MSIRAIVLVSLSLLAPGCAEEAVLPVYLTWSDEDTTTTMTVHYHTVGDFEGTNVYYDSRSRNGDVAAYRHHATGFERRIPGVERTIHVSELRGLAPGTTYYFVVGDPRSGYRRERTFRTIPDDGSPITFVAGGDMSTGLLPRSISRRAALQSPSFALIGGDLAYGGGVPEGYGKWQAWFADWEATMKRPDGGLIPMVLAVGNHDTNSAAPRDAPERRAPFLMGFFHQDPAGRSFFSRRFGPNLSLVVLDTGHLASLEEQRAWLEEKLRASRQVAFRFALYHTALYPAHHDPDSFEAAAGRRLWAPLFDRYELSVAFENHGHVHKRTHPIRAGRVAGAGEGTVYLGDGCWGKSDVETPQRDRWYLARAVRSRHIWKVRVSEARAEYTALSAGGRLIDEYAQQRRD